MLAGFPSLKILPANDPIKVTEAAEMILSIPCGSYVPRCSLPGSNSRSIQPLIHAAGSKTPAPYPGTGTARCIIAMNPSIPASQRTRNLFDRVYKLIVAATKYPIPIWPNTLATRIFIRSFSKAPLYNIPKRTRITPLLTIFLKSRFLLASFSTYWLRAIGSATPEINMNSGKIRSKK